MTRLLKVHSAPVDSMGEMKPANSFITPEQLLDTASYDLGTLLGSLNSKGEKEDMLHLKIRFPNPDDFSEGKKF